MTYSVGIFSLCSHYSLDALTFLSPTAMHIRYLVQVSRTTSHIPRNCWWP